MTLPGKPNFGSSVGCDEILLVREIIEASARAEGGTKQAPRKANAQRDLMKGEENSNRA